MSKSEAKKLKITLIKSGIAQMGKHKLVLAGLGLKKLNHFVLRIDTPEMRGMINKVSHLIKVEEA
jgi:large subunit ribosomal protein L30